MSLGAELGRWLEAATLRAAAASARVGDVAADASALVANTNVVIAIGSAAFGRFHCAPIDTSATVPKA